MSRRPTELELFQLEHQRLLRALFLSVEKENALHAEVSVFTDMYIDKKVH